MFNILIVVSREALRTSSSFHRISYHIYNWTWIRQNVLKCLVKPENIIGSHTINLISQNVAVITYISPYDFFDFILDKTL